MLPMIVEVFFLFVRNTYGDFECFGVDSNW